MSRFRRWPLAVTCLGLGLAVGIVADQRLTGQPPPAPPAPRELTSFSPVVQRVLPAVVSDAAEGGDRVLAVGSPFGLAGSVTHGIISGKSRNNLRLNEHEDFLQTDAAVNPGSSGGPLVDLDGRIVGLTAAIKTKSGGS